jgi:hypothetical protein
MNQEIFDKLRQPIKDKILKWFNEHPHENAFPCRYCIWDRMWANQETYQPIHKCLKSGKDANTILGFGIDGKPIENFLKITNCSSELKDDLIYQLIEYPTKAISESEANILHKQIQDADADDYVCLHFIPRPDGNISIATEEK